MESDEHFHTSNVGVVVNFGDEDQNLLTVQPFEISCLKTVDTNSQGTAEERQDSELVPDKQPLQFSVEEYISHEPAADPLGISELDTLGVLEDFADSRNENSELDPLGISEQRSTKLPFQYPVTLLGQGQGPVQYSENSECVESSLPLPSTISVSSHISEIQPTEDCQDAVQLGICSPRLLEAYADTTLTFGESKNDTRNITQEINPADSIATSSVLTKDLIHAELNQVEPSYTIFFYSCAECSKGFETEERLHDHENEFHPTLPECVQNFGDKVDDDQRSRKSKEDLCKIVRERILRVSLEKIDTRTDTCEICGMRVLAVELSNHRRTHDDEDDDDESSDSDNSSQPISGARPKRSRPSSPAYLKNKTHSKREKSRGPPTSKTSVRLKMKVEAQTKPHECRFCGKRFVSASQCRSHENAHSESLEGSREESSLPAGTESIGDAASRRRRGRPPKARDYGTATSEEIKNQKSHHTCDKFHASQTECKCNTNNQTDPVNSQTIPNSQLQGMPILRPKLEPIHDGNSNSSLDPPELISAELEDRLLPKATNESDSEKKDTCQTCGEEFTRANLLDHIRSHLEVGQRNCSLCPYQGNNRNDLKEHINTHYGLRPYECRYCDKNFCWATGLKRHMLVSHKDMTPFMCNHCPIRFETHRERRRHELTHKNILKPGGSNPTRRSSHNPTHSSEKNSVAVPERSKSVAPSFHTPTSFDQITGLDTRAIAGDDELEQELRKRSLYPIPEYSPTELRISTNTSLLDFRNEIQPKNELNDPSEHPKNNVISYGSKLQELTPTPEFDSFSSMQTGNSNVFVKQEFEQGVPSALSSGSFSEVQHVPAAFSKSSYVHSTLQRTPEYSASHFEGVSSDGYAGSPDRNVGKDKTSTDGASPEIYHDKPDQRESEKCKTCNLNIPMDDLMSHIQSHLRPLQKKCDICSYEATSWKLLPEHMNIHYVLKPFQCNICKRRFAMKGYLRSHHQQVHESADNRRYVCHFCDKRFVRPCHRKAHEKGVHLKEGEALPTPEMRKAALAALGKKQSKEVKESKGKSKNKKKTPPSMPPGDARAPVSIPPPSTNQPVYFSNPVPDQNYMSTPVHWPNSNNQTPDYHNHSHNQNSPHNSGPYQGQGQGHVEIKQENYWMQPQHQHQPEVQSRMHSVPHPSTSSNMNQPNQNHSWSDFHSPRSEFDLKGPQLNTNQYVNTHMVGQGQGQMQDFNYGGNANSYNYHHQGFNSSGMPHVQDYSYGVQNNAGWSDVQTDSSLLNSGSSVAMNYGSYNPGSVNGVCDNIIGSDARWSTADPYGILQTQNIEQQQHQQQPVLHENTYTISRPADPVVDLWAELRNEELKLFPENGFGAYAQQSGSSLGLGMSQQQQIQGMVLDSSSSIDGVPLIAPSRSLPLIPDLLESSDGYTNGYFDGIPEISSDNMYEPSVDGISNSFFDEINDFTPDDSLSAPSGDDLDRTSKVPCRTCGLKFLRADIIEHVRSHLKKGQKTCEICQHTFCSSMALRDHMTTHYAQKPHQCLTCFKYFSTKHSLKNHIVCIHEGKREAKCQICNRAFTLVFSLRRHMRLVHKLNPKNGLKLAPSLPQPRGQSNKNKLNKQQKEEAKQSKLDATRVKLEDDRKQAQDEEGRRNELHRRILERSWIVKIVDVGRNKINCGVCQSSVMVKDLINHRWNHKDPCHICGKPVRIDEMLHHGVSHVISLYCEICSWKARTRSQLYEHMNTHLGLKPIKCNICGASFASRTSLRTHFLARHTKFRPHQCSYCPSAFVQLSVRRLHEMTHYGTKCPVCDEEFERKKDLVTHMKENHWDDDPMPRMQSLNHL